MNWTVFIIESVILCTADQLDCGMTEGRIIMKTALENIVVHYNKLLIIRRIVEAAAYCNKRHYVKQKSQAAGRAELCKNS